MIHSQDDSVAKVRLYAVIKPNSSHEWEPQKPSSMNYNHAVRMSRSLGSRLGPADLTGRFQKVVSHAQGMTVQAPQGTSPGRGSGEAGGVAGRGGGWR